MKRGNFLGPQDSIGTQSYPSARMPRAVARHFDCRLWSALFVLVLSASAGTDSDQPGHGSAEPSAQCTACGRVRAETGRGRLLVLYQYYEAPKAADNLRFFLAKTVLERPGQHDDGADYVFIISGHHCSVPLPEGPAFPHVRVFGIDNTGHDFGAWADALQLLGMSLDQDGEPQGGQDDQKGTGEGEDSDGEWGKAYGAVAFINSSCRQVCPGRLRDLCMRAGGEQIVAC